MTFAATFTIRTLGVAPCSKLSQFLQFSQGSCQGVEVPYNVVLGGDSRDVAGVCKQSCTDAYIREMCKTHSFGHDITVAEIIN
jgi:hypothetical protein